MKTLYISNRFSLLKSQINQHREISLNLIWKMNFRTMWQWCRWEWKRKKVNINIHYSFIMQFVEMQKRREEIFIILIISMLSFDLHPWGVFFFTFFVLWKRKENFLLYDFHHLTSLTRCLRLRCLRWVAALKHKNWLINTHNVNFSDIDLTSHFETPCLKFLLLIHPDALNFSLTVENFYLKIENCLGCPSRRFLTF